MVNLIAFIPIQKAGSHSLGEMLGRGNGLGATFSISEHQKRTAFWSHYNAA